MINKQRTVINASIVMLKQESIAVGQLTKLETVNRMVEF